MKKNSIDNLFKGSGCYTEAANNTVGTILADEAHRLNEKSGRVQNMGENQIKEIIHAAYCSVFFIDELNARLHPLLVRNILVSFINPKINVNHAQLVFTAHDTWQLANHILNKEEVWFVEKDEEGRSLLYSLADFSGVDDFNQDDYLLGKFGAVPELTRMEFNK